MSGSANFDIAKIIAEAKLGSERKAAQVDMCDVFAEALHDTLTEAGIQSAIYTAAFYFRGREWYHAVVKVDGKFFDSLGVFDSEVVRARNKIHPAVKFDLKITPDLPDHDEEFDEMRAFYKKALTKALRASAAPAARMVLAPG